MHDRWRLTGMVSLYLQSAKFLARTTVRDIIYQFHSFLPTDILYSAHLYMCTCTVLYVPPRTSSHEKQYSYSWALGKSRCCETDAKRRAGRTLGYLSGAGYLHTITNKIFYYAAIWDRGTLLLGKGEAGLRKRETDVRRAHIKPANRGANECITNMPKAQPEKPQPNR